MLIVLIFLLISGFLARPSLAISLQLQQEQSAQDRVDLQEAKTLYFETKDASETAAKNQETQARNQEVLIQGRVYVRRSSQTLINHLYRQRYRTEDMVGLSTETRTKVLSRISMAISEIQGQYNLLDTTKNIEAVKKINQEVGSYWQAQKIVINKVVGLSLVEKANQMLDWATKIDQKLELAVDIAQVAGDQIYLAETNLDNMQTYLNQTQDQIDLAEEIFINSTTTTEDFVNGKKILTQIHKILTQFSVEANSLWQKVKN